MGWDQLQGALEAGRGKRFPVVPSGESGRLPNGLRGEAKEAVAESSQGGQGGKLGKPEKLGQGGQGSRLGRPVRLGQGGQGGRLGRPGSLGQGGQDKEARAAVSPREDGFQWGGRSSPRSGQDSRTSWHLH